jgi:hypothetical protein
MIANSTFVAVVSVESSVSEVTTPRPRTRKFNFGIPRGRQAHTSNPQNSRLSSPEAKLVDAIRIGGDDPLGVRSEMEVAARVHRHRHTDAVPPSVATAAPWLETLVKPDPVSANHTTCPAVASRSTG